MASVAFATWADCKFSGVQFPSASSAAREDGPRAGLLFCLGPLHRAGYVLGENRGIYGRPGKRPDVREKLVEKGDGGGVPHPYRLDARAPEGSRARRQDDRLVVLGL
jgi:hypothetical protein